MKKKKKKKVTLLGKIFDIRYLFYDFVRFTGAIPALFYLRVRKKFINKDTKKRIKGSFVIVSNHITFTDFLTTIITFWYRRTSFVMLKGIFEMNGLANWFFRSIKLIPIDRENPTLDTFKQAKRCVNYGHLVCIYPEGHVLLPGENEFDTFKAGAVLISVYCNVPIVPMYILKRKHWWETTKVLVGEPINPKDYISGAIATVEEIEKINKIVKEKEIELSKEILIRYKKED